MTDKELLRAFKANPSAACFRPFLDRYLPFVWASAHRQLGNESDAGAAVTAVFQALANRARKLPRKTILCAWLFRATRLAVARLAKARKRTSADGAVALVVPEENSWERIAPLLDAALDRARPRLRDALLLHVFLQQSENDSARPLRISEARLIQRVNKGLAGLATRLRRCGIVISAENLRATIETNGLVPAPETLRATIASTVEECSKRKPPGQLARDTMRGLSWLHWKRRFRIAAVSFGILLALLAGAGLYLVSIWRSGELFAWLIESSARRQAKEVPEAAQPARPWPTQSGHMLASATSVRSAAEIYGPTNLWLAHLRFSAEQWTAISPKRIPPLRDMMQRDGTFLLRNPNAKRSGLAGVIGYEFNWVHAGFEFGGIEFADVGARFKGNGTYIGSLYGLKRSFKVDLDKFEKDRRLGGINTLNFMNLIEDSSYLSDALGYELFREAGVPAPRTAYAWLTLSIAGQSERKPLGLYLMVENVDSDFAADRFGSRKTPIFKPVTYDLFKDLGDTWPAYSDIYDLKTKASPAQQRRVVELAKLVTHATDAEFAARIAEFLDLDEFAHFLGVLVLLSSYDGFLSNGQNFYMYLDPHSNKFGFIPWDLDHAWGGFPFVETSERRERASIWKPWVNRNRFLQRLMAVEEFRDIYRTRLDESLRALFVPDRLYRRIDEVAAVIRSPIVAESDFRLKRFDQAVSTNWTVAKRDGEPVGPKKPVHQLKRFIANRANSVREQLDGKSEGLVLHMGGPNGR